MTELFAESDRLNAITQRIGYALWQLQELEGIAATYAVMLTLQPGTGVEAGNAALAKAKGRTFGATVRALADTHALDSSVEDRFRNLLDERNWLVHRSREDSRNAVHHDSAMARLVARIDAIAEEALRLLRETGVLIERHTLGRRKISRAQIDDLAAALLREWHAED